MPLTAPPIMTEVFSASRKVFICLKLRMGSTIVQRAGSGCERRCWNWMRTRRAVHEKGRGRPLKWRWREGRTRTRQPYLRANIGQHYTRYTSRNTRTPFPCTAVCIYHQAERNSEGGYMRHVHCAVNFETTFGKRVSCAAPTGTRGP